MADAAFPVCKLWVGHLTMCVWQWGWESIAHARSRSMAKRIRFLTATPLRHALSSLSGFTPAPGAHSDSVTSDATPLCFLQAPRPGCRDTAVHPSPNAAPPAAPPAAAAADASGCGPGSPQPPPYFAGSTLMGLMRLPWRGAQGRFNT